MIPKVSWTVTTHELIGALEGANREEDLHIILTNQKTWKQ